MAIPDPAWGSPIGHALERGFAHTFSENGRDRWDTVCGMEVVLGNGEIVRTGPGACEGSQTWQDQKWGIGPYVDGIFSQSNFGVITKMGFWIRPAHEGYRSLAVFVPRYEDLTRMVDLDSCLQNAGIVNGMTVMGAPMFGGGFMFFNTPPVHTEIMSIINNWNDGSLLTLHEALKDAVDPNGILSAGRYGIWPRHLREETRGA